MLCPTHNRNFHQHSWPSVVIVHIKIKVSSIGTPSHSLEHFLQKQLMKLLLEVCIDVFVAVPHQ